MSVLYDAQARTGATPAWCDASATRLAARTETRRAVWPSKMFTIKLELNTYAERCPGSPVFDASQGDGGMSLGGVPPVELAEALVRYLPAERSTRYGDPVGRADVRQAIFSSYLKLDGTGLHPGHVIQTDGGRDAIQKWTQLVVQTTGQAGGAVLLGAAPWGSYTQGPYLSGLNPLRVAGRAEAAFRITPAAIDEAVAFAEASGVPAVAVILTTPDNPTGHYLPPDELVELVEHAASRVPHVLLDVIYQATIDPELGPYDLPAILDRLSPRARERLAILDGLTKSIGGSNLRSAHLVVGTDDHALRLKGLATHTVLPNALGEAAALEVYGSDDPLAHPWMRRVIVPTAASRALVRSVLAQRGHRFILGQGYYAFINIWPWLGRTLPAEHRWESDGATVDRVDRVGTLKSYLTTRFGLAVVPGSVFHQPEFVRFSYANTPEYTRGALDRLQEALDALEAP